MTDRKYVVCLVTTAAGDWSAVHWVAAVGDWLEVHWVAAAAGNWLAVRWLAGGDWLEVHWVTGEGDWLEVCWVAGAEFGSSWPKVLVSSSFWVDKMWIDASGTDMELLWSPISSFLMILAVANPDVFCTVCAVWEPKKIHPNISSTFLGSSCSTFSIYSE